tara:strand:+ start:438 stop:800 length:363 start_codon:yes stop_codon:yes gene_type:complete
MKLTRTERFMLYTLGRWYVEANKKLKKKSLSVKVSKQTFIQLVLNSGIVSKKQRALYKNLERLEKDKFIKYKNKSLTLTDRGLEYFKKINKEIDSYRKVHRTLNKKNVFKYSDKVQTKFI